VHLSALVARLSNTSMDTYTASTLLLQPLPLLTLMMILIVMIISGLVELASGKIAMELVSLVQTADLTILMAGMDAEMTLTVMYVKTHYVLSVRHLPSEQTALIARKTPTS